MRGYVTVTDKDGKVIEFPPSPDGGFIEGYPPRSLAEAEALVSTISRWWLH